jgi:hypothetical protein
MRDASEISPAEEAQEMLDNLLTEDEQGEVHELYKDVNGLVRWKNVLKEAYPILLELVGELVDNPSMGKEGLPPRLGISKEDGALFEEETPKALARRHWMTLTLAKKLLGGLKTKVSQNLQDIRILSPHEEDTLMEIAGETQEEPLNPEVDIKVNPDTGGGCPHGRTTTRIKPIDGRAMMQTYCHDCRRRIEEKAVGIPYSPKICEHSKATWVEGQEGQEAICANPRCKASIEDPSIYRWDAEGLEPPGDDPANDEVITLCSDY